MNSFEKTYRRNHTLDVQKIENFVCLTENEFLL